MTGRRRLGRNCCVSTRDPLALFGVSACGVCRVFACWSVSLTFKLLDESSDKRILASRNKLHALLMLSISGAIFAISKRLCLCAKPKRNPLCQSKILKRFPSRYFQIADQPGRRALQNCSRMRLFRIQHGTRHPNMTNTKQPNTILPNTKQPNTILPNIKQPNTILPNIKLDNVIILNCIMRY